MLASLYERIFVIQRHSEAILKCFGPILVDSWTFWRSPWDSRFYDTARF